MIEKIVSGGQTGADRAALDFALEHNISAGGFCPRGRLAEDGPIDAKYPLTETRSVDYSERTLQNILHSDGTVIFTVKGIISGGSQDTAKLAQKHNKPCLILKKKSPNALLELSQFIEKRHIKTLNVAGPRASKEPEVAAFVRSVLTDIIFPQS